MTELTATKGIGAGAYIAQVGKRDLSGYPVGLASDPDSLTPGTLYVPHVIDHVDSFTPGSNTIDSADGRGGQRYLGSIMLGTSAFGPLAVQLAQFDEALSAIIKNTVVDFTTVEGWAQSPSNVNQQDFPRLFSCFSTKFLDKNLDLQYMNFIALNSEWSQPQETGSSQAGGVNPNPLQYSVKVSPSARNLTGRLLSATNMVVEGDTDTVIKIRSKWPLAFAMWIDDFSTVTFRLPFLPVFSDATGILNNSITREGTTEAVTTVSIVTGDITLTPGTSGDRVLVVYPTRFVPSPTP